jgi:hypothetical protein
MQGAWPCNQNIGKDAVFGVLSRMRRKRVAANFRHYSAPLAGRARGEGPAQPQLCGGNAPCDVGYGERRARYFFPENAAAGRKGLKSPSELLDLGR